MTLAIFAGERETIKVVGWACFAGGLTTVEIPPINTTRLLSGTRSNSTNGDAVKRVLKSFADDEETHTRGIIIYDLNGGRTVTGKQ